MMEDGLGNDEVIVPILVISTTFLRILVHRNIAGMGEEDRADNRDLI